MPTNNGKNLLTVDGANSNLLGGNGKDILNGDARDNNINGGNGEDTIWGGAGSDTLTGGNGNDTFVYKAGDLAPGAADPSLLGWLPGGSGVPGEVRTDGHYVVDTIYGDSNNTPGGGSLHLWTSSGGSTGKVDVVNYDTSIFDANATLGNLTSLGFDWIRGESSDATSHFAPALRLAFTDAGANGTFGDSDDVSGYLIWEHLYDNQNTPENTADPHDAATEGVWFREDLTDSEMWMRLPGFTVEDFNHTLGDWRAGHTVMGPGAVGAVTLDDTTRIRGIEVGLGSGWTGLFDGAVDNVHIAFGPGTEHTFDFGKPGAPVDQITDFQSGKDTLNLHDLLTGVTAASNVNDYVHATVDGQGNTHLFVDTNGSAGGANFVEFAVLQHATINLAGDIVL